MGLFLDENDGRYRDAIQGRCPVVEQAVDKQPA
jgi:hypothetical protein